jgi:translation initiation factor 1
MRPRLVYTSDPEEARRLREQNRMPEARDEAPDKQIIRVELDRKQRKGKTVTAASGFSLTAASLQDLAKRLKTKCGTGGTAKDDGIELQGDHRDTVTRELTALGFRVKRI